MILTRATSQQIYRWILATMCLAAICAISTSVAFGQTATGQIEGRIVDQTGAVIPQANVMVANVNTGVKRSVQSDAGGRYTVPLLIPGLYRVTVAKTGFKSAEVLRIRLDVNQTVVQDVTLSVGAVTQTVQVTSQADMIQAATSNIGTVVGAKATSNLPLNGRNFTQLLTLVPGVTPVNTSQTQVAAANNDLAVLGVPTASFAIPSIAGQYNRSTQYLIDGINDTEFNDANYVIPPIVDTIEEFKVQMHNDNAEFGGVLGGVVSIITKGGTNEFHGSAYEFLRNNAFDARNPFTDEFRSSPTPFRQNQFGGTVGGPILIPKLYNGRNHTFFYFGYEGIRYTQSAQSRYYVPTAAELNGDFTHSLIARNIYDPATTVIDPSNPSNYIRTQFQSGGVPNIIPANRIDQKVARFIQAYFDRPNLTGDPIHNEIVTLPDTATANEYNGRLDEQLGGKDSLFLRWSEYDGVQTAPSSYTSGSVGSTNARQVATGWNHIISPSMIIEARGGFSARPFIRGSYNTVGFGPGEALGFTSPGGTSIGLSAPWGGGGYSLPNTISSPTWNITGSLSWVHGQHNFKFGLQWLRQGNDNTSTGAGSYTFTNTQTENPEQPGTTGASLASALLGLPNQTNITNNNDFSIRYSVWSEYGQDEWKLRNNLTLNYGLRFDYRRPMGSYAAQSFIGGAVPETGDYWIGLNQMPGLCSQVRAAPCLPAPLAQIPAGNHIMLSPYGRAWGPATEWDDWGPRVGIAWRINNKTVVRSGFDVVYDPLSGIDQDWKGLQGGWPAASGLWSILPWNPVGGTLTTVEQTFGQVGVPLPTASPWSQTNWYFDPDHKDSRSLQWNVEIQRQMNNNLALSVGYEGSRSDRLDSTGNWDTATTPGPGTLAQVNARRPFPWWTGDNYMGTSIGRSNFNALEVKLERRFAGNLYYLVSYTYSKSIDNGSSGWFDAENGPGGGSLQNYYDPAGSRSVSSYDIPQSLAMSGMYELPFGRGMRFFSQHGAASWLLGNWQVNGIVAARSGQPFTVFSCADVANIGNTNGSCYARPNLIGNPDVPNRTSEEWFNTSAFVLPSFNYGNLGRNTLRSMPLYNMDFSLFKNFLVREGTNLEFRAEFFNVFNHQTYAPPDGLFGSPGFGQVTSTINNSREIQFALRLTF